MPKQTSKEASRRNRSQKPAPQATPLATTSAARDVKEWGEDQANRATVLDIVLCMFVAPLMIQFGYFEKPNVVDQVGGYFPEIFLVMLIGTIFLRVWSYQEMI